MRKTTFALGLGLAFSLGAADLAAQQQRPARTDSAKAGASGSARGDRARQARPNTARMQPGPAALLRGITLTDAQKAQLETIREQQLQVRRAARESDQQRMEAARAARQSGDTAAMRALREQQRTRMVQERERQIAAIRGILTAEQRAQFDSNVTEMRARAGRRDAPAGKRGPTRDNRGPARGH